MTGPEPLFEPRLALASLSGASDADWALAASEYAGCAFLGGIALDDATRAAARTMVEDRDREEFLPADSLAFIDDQLAVLDDQVAAIDDRAVRNERTTVAGDAARLRVGFNVRATTPGPVRAASAVCADHDAVLEVNAHCRQEEMCAAGAGESLLRDVDRLSEQVAAAVDGGAPVSVKVRAEVPGVDLPAVARGIESAGATAIHVDAMDSEAVVADVVAACDLFVVANNGVRDRATAHEYIEHGADAVSVGRPSDDPVVLARVRDAVDEWFAGDGGSTEGDGRDAEHESDGDRDRRGERGAEV